MQYPFSCVPPVMGAIETALSPARLNRFMPAAGGDRALALRLHVWNARLCEAFYLPTQLAEVSTRNALHSAVAARYGKDWHAEAAFLSNLPNRLLDELQNVIARERSKRKQGFTADHVVAGLSFGFWVHLVSKSFDHLLWKRGVAAAFPHVPRGTTRVDVHGRLNGLRNWRNLIAHHYAVFDRSPMAEFQNIVGIIRWICPDTGWFAHELSNVPRVLNQRPRAHGI